MKRIIKDPEPIEFIEWKKQANENWQPTYADLRGTAKKSVKASLLKEQGHICCYCEQQLIDRESHIEHFQPQHPDANASEPAVDPLDYSNMLCSCQNDPPKGIPLHCGNSKGNWFDSVLLISPFSEICEQRFHFNQNGTIRAADDQDQAAVTMIARLGLDLPILNDLRRQAIEPFLDEALTLEELEDFVDGYLQKSADGKFGQFWTTIQQLFQPGT
jgi:uncharacterized protein (TIGR02646 family)